jgi:hypothetical protein
MEIFFALLIKLTVIFLGSGIVTLLGYWITCETSTIPKLILCLSKKKDLKIVKNTKISTKSSFYEVQVSDNDSIKLFSTSKGIKVLN